MSIHHIVPKNRGGYPGVDKNVISLKDEHHYALHTMFGDASPAQQIQEIMYFDAPQGEKFLELSLYLGSLRKKTATGVYKPGIIVKEGGLHLPINYHSKSPSKVLRAQGVLFGERAHTESKIQRILSIGKRSLQSHFSNQVLNIVE